VGHVGRHAVAREQHERPSCHDTGQRKSTLCCTSPQGASETSDGVLVHGVQVLLGHPGDQDAAGNDLPRLFYVSREKKPGFQHHTKAGALNALVRVSSISPSWVCSSAATCAGFLSCLFASSGCPLC